MINSQVNWGGYIFTVCDMNAPWNDVPGVYIFAGLDATGQWWSAKYIGQTNSFRQRMWNHERWQEAMGLGATHVHGMVMQDAAQRLTAEADLIEGYRPPLNG